MSRSASRQRRASLDNEPIEIDDVEIEEVNSDEGEEEEEEEYEVEAIVDHRHEKGKIKYLVAWKGYGPEHNTWEPDENVQHAEDIVKAYWAKQPKSGKIQKRKEAPTAPQSSGRRGRASTGSVAAESIPDEVHFSDTHRDEMSKYQDIPDWETLVRSIDTVERTSKNGLIVYLTMKDGERFGVSNAMANRRCPQVMLRFYEKHLKWRGAD